MKSYFYDLRYISDIEAWRIRAKRDLVFKFWGKYQSKVTKGMNKMPNILDFGCGTGVLQEQFENKFKVKAFGIDISKKAINYCQKRGLSRVKVFRGIKIPFKTNYFSLVTAIDVLEHINDDLQALREIKRVLKKNGLAILLVPAHSTLWSTRDVNLKHFRRYNAGELEKKCNTVGFKLLSSKNVDFAIFFVFSLICLFASKKNGVPNLKMDVETASGNKVINEIIYGYEWLENQLQSFLTFPVGLSIAVVVQKK